MDLNNLRTVRQLADEAAPIITEAKIRWWMFHAKDNGLSKAIVRIGGRIYLDIQQFNIWLESKRDEAVDVNDSGAKA